MSGSLKTNNEPINHMSTDKQPTNMLESPLLVALEKHW